MLFVFIFMHTGVQHDFHIRLCSVTRWVSLVEQE